MPAHDWTRVDAGIFHAFYHRWISAISDALNQGILPSDYYALPEQHAVGFGPDVLTLQSPRPEPPESSIAGKVRAGRPSTLLERPGIDVTAETDLATSPPEVRCAASPPEVRCAASWRKRPNFLRTGFTCCWSICFLPAPRDPQGLHAALREEIAGSGYHPPEPGAVLFPGLHFGRLNRYRTPYDILVHSVPRLFQQVEGDRTD